MINDHVVFEVLFNNSQNGLLHDFSDIEVLKFWSLASQKLTRIPFFRLSVQGLRITEQRRVEVALKIIKSSLSWEREPGSNCLSHCLNAL